jgi:hypothetical protein
MSSSGTRKMLLTSCTEITCSDGTYTRQGRAGHGQSAPHGRVGWGACACDVVVVVSLLTWQNMASLSRVSGSSGVAPRHTTKSGIRPSARIC